MRGLAAQQRTRYQETVARENAQTEVVEQRVRFNLPQVQEEAEVQEAQIEQAQIQAQIQDQEAQEEEDDDPSNDPFETTLVPASESESRLASLWASPPGRSPGPSPARQTRSPRPRNDTTLVTTEPGTSRKRKATTPSPRGRAKRSRDDQHVFDSPRSSKQSPKSIKQSPKPIKQSPRAKQTNQVMETNKKVVKKTVRGSPKKKQTVDFGDHYNLVIQFLKRTRDSGLFDFQPFKKLTSERFTTLAGLFGDFLKEARDFLVSSSSGVVRGFEIAGMALKEFVLMFRTLAAGLLMISAHLVDEVVNSRPYNKLLTRITNQLEAYRRQMSELPESAKERHSEMCRFTKDAANSLVQHCHEYIANIVSPKRTINWEVKQDVTEEILCLQKEVVRSEMQTSQMLRHMVELQSKNDYLTDVVATQSEDIKHYSIQVQSQNEDIKRLNDRLDSRKEDIKREVRSHVDAHKAKIDAEIHDMVIDCLNDAFRQNSFDKFVSKGFTWRRY